MKERFVSTIDIRGQVAESMEEVDTKVMKDVRV